MPRLRELTTLGFVAFVEEGPATVVYLVHL